MKVRRKKHRKARVIRTVSIALKRIKGMHDYCSGPLCRGSFLNIIRMIERPLNRKRRG